MLKLMFVACVCAVVYFCGVGFLDTAARLGWNGSTTHQVQSTARNALANR